MSEMLGTSPTIRSIEDSHSLMAINEVTQFLGLLGPRFLVGTEVHVLQADVHDCSKPHCKGKKREDFAFQVSFVSNHCKLILRADACCSLPGAPKIYEPAEWETVKGKARQNADW